MIPRIGVGQNPKINKEIPHPSTFNQCICVYIYTGINMVFCADLTGLLKDKQLCGTATCFVFILGTGLRSL